MATTIRSNPRRSTTRRRSPAALQRGNARGGCSQKFDLLRFAMEYAEVEREDRQDDDVESDPAPEAVHRSGALARERQASGALVRRGRREGSRSRAAPSGTQRSSSDICAFVSPLFRLAPNASRYISSRLFRIVSVRARDMKVSPPLTDSFARAGPARYPLERRLRILVLEDQFFRSPKSEPAWIEWRNHWS